MTSDRSTAMHLRLRPSEKAELKSAAAQSRERLATFARATLLRVAREINASEGERE
jgi:hypothetical protein